MIQPLDIKTQKFKKGLFGYKSTEVDTFIDAVYKAYDDLFKENKELSDNLEKLNSSLQENRLKIFELENELQNAENVSSQDADDADAKKKAEKIIQNAEKAAADIIAKAKAQSEKIENGVKEEAPKAQAPKTEEKKENASSRFFKKAEEEAVAAKANDDDDDEIFVGEIEEARKPDRMMIGDGEEEADMDFEFL